jgi:hypothetical protein
MWASASSTLHHEGWLLCRRAPCYGIANHDATEGALHLSSAPGNADTATNYSMHPLGMSSPGCPIRQTSSSLHNQSCSPPSQPGRLCTYAAGACRVGNGDPCNDNGLRVCRHDRLASPYTPKALIVMAILAITPIIIMHGGGGGFWCYPWGIRRSRVSRRQSSMLLRHIISPHGRRIEVLYRTAYGNGDATARPSHGEPIANAPDPAGC